MRLFGFEIRRTKARTLSTVDDSRGWMRIFDSHTGAWQQDIVANRDSVLAQSTVFACVTLIASDIAKMCLDLVEKTIDGIWEETTNSAFSPVLRKPNRFQTRQRFIENWIISKLIHGNAYVLKIRDRRNVVVAMYVLDPCRVTPLVALDGTVYYRLGRDNLAVVAGDEPAVPASEIIHDRMNCLFHPLVGISPIFACGLAATQALKIQTNSAKFFENMSRPSGLLTAPAEISDITAERLKKTWETNYSGENIGKVAVLGDGLQYQAMTVNPLDAQMVEQLGLTGKQIAATFHVPGYKVGVEAPPAYNNIQALDIKYYGECLQPLTESVELCLDEGLGIDLPIDGRQLGTQFNLDDLLRMDEATLTTALKDQVGSGIAKPNEARRRLNYGPVKGGDTPYLQQQQFSLAALDERDQDKPFSKPTSPPAAQSAANDSTIDQAGQKALAGMLTMALRSHRETA